MMYPAYPYSFYPSSPYDGVGQAALTKEQVFASLQNALRQSRSLPVLRALVARFNQLAKASDPTFDARIEEALRSNARNRYVVWGPWKMEPLVPLMVVETDKLEALGSMISISVQSTRVPLLIGLNFEGASLPGVIQMSRSSETVPAATAPRPPPGPLPEPQTGYRYGYYGY